MKLQEIYRVSLMPSKADYKQIIEDKLTSAESDKKNQGKTDGVTSTDQSKGSSTHVSTKDKLH